MLQAINCRGNCRHCLPLPVESCLLCTKAAPEPLLDISLNYILDHLDTLCESNYITKGLQLRENISLPVEICERLLSAQLNKNRYGSRDFVYIFRNLEATRLKRIRIRNADLDDLSLAILMDHRPTELELINCACLTPNCVKYITLYGTKLQSLVIGENTHIVPVSI